ncbi:MAG: hypothetical protein KME45_09885 [Stenomitos rutilans HA7619-LM2]|nr:hypothetical protein [Stenomitos rutilans HA7619-LM2]
MSDPTEKTPPHETQAEKLKEEGLFDPLELVSKGGYTGTPREIIENPAVAPEMLDRPEDLRDDLLAEPEDEP